MGSDGLSNVFSDGVGVLVGLQRRVCKRVELEAKCHHLMRRDIKLVIPPAAGV
jgi:hypothetical protein